MELPIEYSNMYDSIYHKVTQNICSLYVPNLQIKFSQYYLTMVYFLVIQDATLQVLGKEAYIYETGKYLGGHFVKMLHFRNNKTQNQKD